MPSIIPLPQATWPDRLGAADYLTIRWGICLTATKLARMAGEGVGPDYLVVGRSCRYPLSNLDAWAKQQFRQPLHARRKLASAADE